MATRKVTPLTAELLRQTLDYDPDTGCFTWRRTLRKTFGTDKGNGRRIVRVHGRIYYAHRLAWLHYYGVWPKYDVDHIDGDSGNNVIANLRDIPHRYNMENRRDALPNNASGHLGVRQHRTQSRLPFYARIRTHNQTINLGSFATAEEAHAAYLSAKEKLHKGYVPADDVTAYPKIRKINDGNAKRELTVDLLRSLLDYNRDDGTFIWKWNGSIASGSVKKTGYRYLSIDGGEYLAHRLAWLHVHGSWPKHYIDHIDGNPANNAIANLRDVTQAVNTQNRRSAGTNSTTGMLGVSYYGGGRKKPYAARIQLNGVVRSLGYFATAEEAHQAYLVGKRKIHEGNTL